MHAGELGRAAAAAALTATAKPAKLRIPFFFACCPRFLLRRNVDPNQGRSPRTDVRACISNLVCTHTHTPGVQEKTEPAAAE